jgi:NitT/TauT family transport system ATP-binding protein
MWGELLQIRAASRATIVFVTHSLVEAVYLADEVLVMAARPGRIVERIAVDLPQPRTLDMLGSPVLGALRNRIWHLIAEPQP